MGIASSGAKSPGRGVERENGEPEADSTREFLQLAGCVWGYTGAEESDARNCKPASICAVRQLKRGEEIANVLRRFGLSEAIWRDAKMKYTKLSKGGI